MSNTTYMIQECPVCGRRLQIRVEYLGSRVSCAHCSGTFEVTEKKPKHHQNAPSLSLLERAEQLLESSDTRQMRARQV